MVITAPDALDAETDVLLDVAGALSESRAHKPAVWVRGFGESALALPSYRCVVLHGQRT